MDKKKYTLKEVKKSIKSYIRYLQDEYDLPIKKVYLFGSYAKNKQHNWSDIDFCIISPKFKHVDALPYLWRKRREQDVEHLLAPVGFHPDDFVDESPLVWEIKRTGKEIKV